MSVEVTGIEEMMKEIEHRFGKTAMRERVGQAIMPGAKKVHRNMARSMESFKDTGASIEEMQISSVQTNGGKIIVHIYWEGPKQRYRLIHLNERGYTRGGKRYKPRGQGAIARALRQSEQDYFETVKRGLSQ